MSEAQPPIASPNRGRRLLFIAGCSCGALALCAIAAALAAFFEIRPSPNAPGRTVVTASGGLVEGKGATVKFPEGAVAKEATVGIALVEKPPSPSDANLALVGPLFELESSAPRFEKDVEVTLPYDPSRLSPGRHESDVRAFHRTPRGYAPVRGCIVDPSRHVVRFKTPHFSGYVAGQTRAGSTLRPRPPAPPGQHAPSYPFDIWVVDSISVPDSYVEDLRHTIDQAYARLTVASPRLPMPFLEPPFDPEWDARGQNAPAPSRPHERLVVEVTSLVDAGKTEPWAAGVCHDDGFIQVDKANAPAKPIWEVALHEFFHAIQDTYFQRNIRLPGLGAGLTFGSRGAGFHWLQEATANWATHRVLPAESVRLDLVREDFCFEELFYDSQADPDAAPDPSRHKHHQYQAAVFFEYLESRWPGIVLSTLSSAYVKANEEWRLLDAVLREKTGGKENVASVYKDFVLAHAFTKTFVHDPKPWALGASGVLSVPADKLVGLALEDGKTATSTIAKGQEVFYVPRVWKLVLPRIEKGQKRTLELALGGGERWMWAIVATASGAQKLAGGAKDKLEVDVDSDAREVFVVPVALDMEATPLALAAKLVGSKPRLTLTWDRELTYECWFGPTLRLDVESGAMPAVKKLVSDLGDPIWLHMEIDVAGRRFHLYSRTKSLTEFGRAEFFDSHLRVKATGPIDAVATVKLGKETVSASKRIPPSESWLASSRFAREKAEKLIDDCRRRLKTAKGTEADMLKDGLGRSLIDLAAAHYDSGDDEAAEKAWAEAASVGKKAEAALGRSNVALDAGDVDAYEKLTRQAGYEPNADLSVQAAVRCHDDPERAWSIIDRLPEKERSLFRDRAILPLRGEKIAR